MRWLSSLTFLALAACSFDFAAFDPRLGGGQAGGGEGGHAAGGGNTTTAGGDTGGVGGSGGAVMGPGGSGGSGGSEPLPCGIPELAADDFDTLSSLWSASAGSGASFEIMGGEVVITLAEQTSSWSGLSSRHLYDLRDARVFVKVNEVPNPATNAAAMLTVSFDGDNYAQVVAQGGEIQATQTIAGSWTQLYAGDYDPVQHRWWQLREAAGTTYFEVSGDGSTFATLASTSTSLLFPMDLVELGLAGYTGSAVTSPGQVRYDDFMGGGTPAAGWCASETLSDDFEDGMRARAWDHAYASGDASFSEVGGQLVLSHGPGAGETAYHSAQAFELTEAGAAVEVPTVASQPASYAFFRLERDYDHGLEILAGDGLLRCRMETGGTLQTIATTAYGPNTHRWWRIREENGLVRWETSADGTSWTEHVQQAAPFAPSGLTVVLGSALGSDAPASDATIFDNYNLTP